MARLLLVEDHTLVRAGVRALLEASQNAHQIVGEAANGFEAARLARNVRPDLAIVDVTMPEINGIETTRLILEACPATRAIMLSMHPDSAFVHAALEAGATGYVLKDAAFGDLEAAIRAALSGQKYLSPGIRASLKAGDALERGPASLAVNVLSRRERQILQMIGEAFSSKEIAEKLGLRVRTVETYRQNMMNKLQLHSVAALTSFAIRHGLCDPSTGVA
jgi:two-component system, NarL family, response regulator NreC